MKKALCVVVGAATLAAGVYFSGRLQAQAPTGGVTPVRAATPTAKSKIAILNLKYVVTNYQRFKNFNEENKKAAQDFEARLKPLTLKMEAWQKQIQDPATDAVTKERIQQDAKPIQRQIQDITEEARGKIGKQESEQLVTIYREVGAAVSRYATANDIELVLHYADGTNEVEMNSSPNIHQKMGQRALIPLYWGQGVDISYPVLQMLNSSFASGGAQPR